MAWLRQEVLLPVGNLIGLSWNAWRFFLFLRRLQQQERSELPD